MVHPEDRWNISDVMFSVKKQFSHNINRVMGCNSMSVPPEGGQALARLRVFGVLRHGNNWPYVYKFDQYVQKLKTQFQRKHSNHHPFSKFQWKESFHDHYTRNQTDFIKHMNYISGNPDKHNMPKNWTYVFTNANYGDLIDEF
jgi:hypothetical protein